MTSKRFTRTLTVPTCSTENEPTRVRAAIDLFEDARGLRIELRHAGDEPKLGWPRLFVQRRLMISQITHIPVLITDDHLAIVAQLFTASLFVVVAISSGWWLAKIATTGRRRRGK